MSNNLNSKKPRTVVMRICLVEISAVMKKGIARKVSAWPANSSATTSRGSVLPVAAIAAGANMTQTTEPKRTRAAIVIAIGTAETPKWHIAAKIIAGGSEPHVPGASGSRPSPKHDVSILFIFAEG
jgi:hypothetical protein